MRAKHDHQPTVFARNASRRALLALALVFLGAGPAAATTYYVSTGGSDTNAGTQAAPWRTLAKANATLVAGDVCSIGAGTYSDPIAPAASGTAISRISYVGSITNPAGTIVSSLTLSQNYISVRGVTVTTSGEVAVHGSDDALEDCVINASILNVTGTGADLNPAVKAARNTFRDISFALYRTTGLTSTTVNCRGMEDCTFDSCRFVITHPSNVTSGSFLKMFYSPRNRFTDCSWSMTSLVASHCDECTWVVIRDNSASNAFIRNTFTMTSPTSGDPTVFYAAVAGNAGNAGGVHGLKFDSCVWRATNPLSPGVIIFQDPMTADTLKNCVVVAPTVPAITASAINSVVIDHCTFVSSTADGRVVAFSDNPAWSGTSTITNNILYSLASGATRAPAWFRGAPGYLTANYNLFYSSAGDTKAVDYGSLDFHSVAQACSGHGMECSSLFGNPALVGGSTVLDYDAHLTTASPARGKAGGGSDIGAFPFVAGGGDVTPPAAVTDLVVVQVSNDYALLRWTAPGDDGSTGTAAAYDLRYSTQPINAANFAAATQATPAPTIQPAGSAQNYAMTGLTASTTYYFALKARDAANNWAVVSNVPTAATTATDQLAPARITDFH